MAHRFTALGCFALALVAGCGSGPTVEDAGGPPVVELGVGTTAFEPFPSDGAELVFGPQGGWHVDLAVRFRNASPEDATVTYAVRELADGRERNYPARSSLNVRRVVRDGPWSTRVGDRAVLDIERDSEVLGRRFEFSVTLRTAEGAEVSDSRVAEVVDRER